MKNTGNDPSPGFEGLGVHPFFAGRLLERGIRLPTAVQSLAMPPLLAGKSLIFSSATGTGKTFAYLIPLVQNLFPPGTEDGASSEAEARSGGPEMLICGPTYELCSQIKQELDFLLEGMAVKRSLIIGSGHIGRQIDALKRDKPRIVAGNPGRLLQLCRMGKLSLISLKALVLDEADRLVSGESQEETAAFFSFLKTAPQAAACSATISAKSRRRLEGLMGETAFAETSEQEILRERIEHWAFFSEERRKIGLLRSLLSSARPSKALIFTCLSGQVGNIVSQLQYHKIAAAGLFGNMGKLERKAAIDGFRGSKVKALVSSDLAGRGLDIPGITHVIALDVPPSAETYIHRAGRTGRAGRQGVMASIGGEADLRNLSIIEKKLGIAVYPKDIREGRIVPADSA